MQTKNGVCAEGARWTGVDDMGHQPFGYEGCPAPADLWHDTCGFCRAPIRLAATYPDDDGETWVLDERAMMLPVEYRWWYA